MNDKVYKAKRALLGLGDFEMTAEGELTNLEPGRDGIRHIPKGCRAIDASIFYSDLPETVREAEIRFCENSIIKLYGNTVLKVKPYKANKISDIIVDLRYTTDIFWVLELFVHLKNIRVRYIFNDKSFATQAETLYCYFGFSKDVGWRFAKRRGKLAVFIGTTDVTERFCDVNILEDILGECSKETAEGFMQKFSNAVKKMGVEVPDNLLSVKWCGK